jgi:hypothetical protein
MIVVQLFGFSPKCYPINNHCDIVYRLNKVVNSNGCIKIAVEVCLPMMLIHGCITLN